MLSRFLIPLSTYLIFLFLTGCNGTDTETLVSFPNIDLECKEDNLSSCGIAANNKIFYLGLVASQVGVNCANLIRAAQQGSFFSGFQISSSIEAEFFIDKLRATPQTWVDESNSTLTQVTSGNYTLCGFLDLNGNEKIDTTEPFTQEVISTSTLTQLIDSWSSF